MHIDTDEGNAAGLAQGAVGEIVSRAGNAFAGVGLNRP
jgi:hypothetical protein